MNRRPLVTLGGAWAVLTGVAVLTWPRLALALGLAWALGLITAGGWHAWRAARSSDPPK